MSARSARAGAAAGGGDRQNTTHPVDATRRTLTLRCETRERAPPRVSDRSWAHSPTWAASYLESRVPSAKNGVCVSVLRYKVKSTGPSRSPPTQFELHRSALPRLELRRVQSSMALSSRALARALRSGALATSSRSMRMRGGGGGGLVPPMVQRDPIQEKVRSSVPSAPAAPLPSAARPPHSPLLATRPRLLTRRPRAPSSTSTTTSFGTTAAPPSPPSTTTPRTWTPPPPRSTGSAVLASTLSSPFLPTCPSRSSAAARCVGPPALKQQRVASPHPPHQLPRAYPYEGLAVELGRQGAASEDE